MHFKQRSITIRRDCVFFLFIAVMLLCAAIPATATEIADNTNIPIQSNRSDDITKNGGGISYITIVSNVTLEGNVTNQGTGGILNLRMSDPGANLLGTAKADGTGNIVSIDYGTITASTDHNALIVENDGRIQMYGTTVVADGADLIYSATGGTVHADNSTLLGSVAHEGTGTLDIDMTGSTLAGSVTNADGSTLGLNLTNSRLDGALTNSGSTTMDMNGGVTVDSVVNDGAGTLDVTVNGVDNTITNGAANTGSGTLSFNLQTGSGLSSDISNEGTGTLDIDMTGSTLTGNVTNADGATLDLNMANSRLDGVLTNSGNATMDMNGDATVGSVVNNGTGTLDVTVNGTRNAITNGAVNTGSGTLGFNLQTNSGLNGNLSNDGTGTLDIDMMSGSMLRGNLSNNGAGTLDIDMQNNSGLNGSIDNNGTGTLNLDILMGSIINGAVTNADGAAMDINMTGSLLLGALTNSGSATMSMNGGVMANQIVNDGAGTLDVTVNNNGNSIINGAVNTGSGTLGFNLQADSGLSGNLSNAGTGALNIDMMDGSTLNGNVSNEGTGTLDIDMMDGSTLNGSLSNNGDGTASIAGGTITGGVSNGADGTLDITMTDGGRIENGVVNSSENLLNINMSDSSITGNVNDSGAGLLNITMAGSTITGDLLNTTGDGALIVNMDSSSSVTGTALVDGLREINIDGGTITAAAGNNTLEAENGGTINLIGTAADASDRNLIYSATGGTVNASNSTLRGDITHEGGESFTVNLTDTSETGDVKADGDGDLTVEMTNSTITGDLLNTTGGGALNVNMDIDSSVTGTALVDGLREINIDGGTITAATGNNTLEAENGGTLNLTNTTAEADGANLIYSATGGIVNASNSTLRGDITHEGDNALDLFLDAWSKLEGDLINTSGSGALNVTMDSSSSVTGTAFVDGPREINIDGGMITAAAGKDTLVVENGGTINLTDTAAEADGANLIYSATGGTVNAVDSILQGDITHEGGALLTVNLTDTFETGDVRADGDGDLTVEMANSDITGDLLNTTGDGVLNVNMDNDSSVTGTALADGGGRAIYIDGGAITAAAGKDTLIVENGSLINLNSTAAGASDQNLIYSATGGFVDAVNSTLQGDVRSDGDSTLAIWMANSNITGDLLNTTGGGALDVIMDSSSSVTGTARSNGGGVVANVIMIEGGAITAAAGGNTLEVESGGTINVTGSAASASDQNLVYSDTGGTVWAYGSTFTGDVTQEGNGALMVTLSDDASGNGSTLTGDVFNAGALTGGYLDLNISAGSAFTGAITTTADRTSGVNVASGAVWTVSDDCSLGLGNLDNGGVVDFNARTAYMTIKAGELGANGATDGLFDIKMDVVAQAADKLEIANTAAGSYTLTSQADDATLATSGRERFNLVEIGGASTANFELTSDMELGAWMYSLRQTAFGSGGTAFQVYSTGLSNAASAAVNTIAAGYLMGYAETNTLIQRLGELRDTDYANGFWARIHGGKFNTDGMRHGKEFDLDYGGVQIGYDRKYETSWDGSFYAGIMFGYSKGDIDFAYAGGGGDVESKTLGVYGTFKRADGLYVDAVLKYQWIDYEFDTFNSTGTKVTANDVDGGGFGASVEAGKRFELKNSWFVEPQAQISYQKQDGGVFNMSNGLRLGVSDWTSLQGRLGARVGYESGAHSFYAKLSWVKEFDGDLDFKANGVGFKDTFDDNWWVYGIGYVSKINDRNSLYLDVERSSGGVFEQDWSVRGGWRVEF